MPDEKILDKIRQLLAHAEGTTFAEEAESYFAKAQELMLKHAIDEAMLRQDERIKTAQVVQRFVTLPSKTQLVKAKRELLQFIAHQNRCRPFLTGAHGRGEIMIIVGFERDTEFVEMLYTSVLLHMVTECERELRALPKAERGNANVWRNNFAHGYALRIYFRLAEANRAVETTAVQTNALALYTGEIDDWIARFFGPTEKVRDNSKKRQYDQGARDRGDVAARSADLSGGRSQADGSRLLA